MEHWFLHRDEETEAKERNKSRSAAVHKNALAELRARFEEVTGKDSKGLTMFEMEQELGG